MASPSSPPASPCAPSGDVPVSPNPYAAVRRDDVELYFLAVPEFDPAESMHTVVVLVPDTGALEEVARADGMVAVEQQQAAVADGGELGVGQPGSEPDGVPAEVDHPAGGDGAAGDRDPGWAARGERRVGRAASTSLRRPTRRTRPPPCCGRPQDPRRAIGTAAAGYPARAARSAPPRAGPPPRPRGEAP